jgi:hypothetical protein
MDEKVPELLDLTRKILNQSMKVVNDSLPSIESVPAEEVRYSIFLRVQMSEALKLGYGAYHSCNSGWGHGGIGAARSIYEILLDIKYINHDELPKDERFTRFLDHGAEYLYLKMERELQIGAIISQKKQTELKNAYDQLKKKYNDKHKQDINSDIKKADATPKHRPYNWAGLDLRKKVGKINSGQSQNEKVDLWKFHQLYKELSDLSHVSIRATLNAIVDATENQLEVDLSLYPSLVHCYDVLTVVFTCISGVLEEYMKYFGIRYSNYPDLENLWKDYKELLNR